MRLLIDEIIDSLPGRYQHENTGQIRYITPTVAASS